jgi:regulator of replication initiation timing
MSDSALSQHEIDALLAGVEGEPIPESIRNVTDERLNIAREAWGSSRGCMNSFKVMADMLKETATNVSNLKDTLRRLIEENSGEQITNPELLNLAQYITNSGIASAGLDKKMRKVVRKNSAGLFVLLFHCNDLLNKLNEIDIRKSFAENILNTVTELADEELREYEP